MDMTAKTCDPCGKSLEGLRTDAEHCSTACRMKAYRKKNPLIAPGPLLREVIATRRHHVEAKAKGVSTLKNFDALARSLTPLAHRHVASISAAEWETWWVRATANFRASTRTQWARMVKTLLRDVPNWFNAVVPFTQNAPPSPPPALPPRRLAGLESLPRTERTRLALALAREGFLPIEIRGFTLGAGEILPGKPAWGRRDMPSVPTPLLERLRLYANSKGLSPGTQLFPVSCAAIYAVVSGAGRKRGLKLSPTALTQSARRAGG